MYSTKFFLHFVKSSKEKRANASLNPHVKKNVCLLKEEKLLIEKLTLIIGGFYQRSKRNFNFSCLIKYFEGRRTGQEILQL